MQRRVTILTSQSDFCRANCHGDFKNVVLRDKTKNGLSQGE